MIRNLVAFLFVVVAILGLALVIDVGAARLGVAQAQAQPLDAGSGSGSGSGSAITAPARPSDAVANPLDDPQEALTEVKAAKKQGWPLFVLMSLVMIAKLVQGAGKRWPDNRIMKWLNTDSRSFIIAGIGTVGSAAFDVAFQHGGWPAIMFAGIGAGLALMQPHSKPATS